MYQHNFSGVFNKGLAIAKKDFFKVNGRMIREDYFSYLVVLMLAAIVASVIPILGWIACVLMQLSLLFASIRRLHDVGLSGWWVLVPGYNMYLLVQDTENADNMYGKIERKTETAASNDSVDRELEAARAEVDAMTNG
ncbi:MAG: DUF805 domain-containing protein [Proteobacteria bacterium]|nr:DUF805 domain-containing protein [Pseudomonadota bacterium]